MFRGEGMSKGFQLGQLPGGVPAVPDSSEEDREESPAKRTKGGRPGANKARREGGASSPSTVSLDWQQLEALLDRQADKILAANQKQAQVLLDALEESLNAGGGLQGTGSGLFSVMSLRLARSSMPPALGPGGTLRN